MASRKPNQRLDQIIDSEETQDHQGESEELFGLLR